MVAVPAAKQGLDCSIGGKMLGWKGERSSPPSCHYVNRDKFD